mgnify:CR=1 FL=1
MRTSLAPDSPEGLRHQIFLLERERERLLQLKASSERDRNNAIKMIALVVIAVPVGVLTSVWWALAVVVQVILLVIGTWYITGVHILEYTGNLLDCDQDLRLQRATLAALAAPRP